MVFPADTFQEATELAVEASNQLHGVINGDANAEVTVEDGSKIPSVRKAMVDSLYFKPPITWAQGEYEDTYNQLRAFVEPTGITTWWFSKTATVSTPILMSTAPHEDTNWTLWNAINNSVYETQKRLAAEAGLNMVGSFLLGATVTNVGDVVFYETDGKYYGWGGTLPKVVAAGSTPTTSGGVGAGLWSDKTGLMLRAEWYGEIGNVHYYGLVPDGVTDNSAQLLSLFQTYENLYFPKGTYVLTDDRCVNALRTKAVSTTVKYHPEAKFIGGGKLPYSISNTDHRAHFDYSVKYFDSGDSYSTSKGAQTLALEAVSSASFTGNAVGLYTGAVGASGSTGGIWAANPIAIANAGFAGRVRAVEIDVENNSTSTIDSFGLTIWGGGAYDITQAFKFSRSNNVSLYQLGGEIACAKSGLKLTSIGNHPTRSGEHGYALSITDCPKNAITIQPTALNNSAQIYGKSVDGSSAIWRINNDGSTYFPQVTSPKVIADKIELNTHVYTATPFKFGAYYMWYGDGGILRASTSAPETGTDGNPFGVKVAVPTTATSTGYIGQWAADASYMYVCTATNVWKRVALSTW